ncbi:MAG: TonB-dependent receptor [Cyclobacteriaceae bacterium]
MKLYITTLIFLLGTIHVWAQQIQGKVYDASTKAPLVGANVQVAGSASTVTGNGGAFSAACSGSVEITVSFVGYITHKQTVNDCNELLNIGLTLANQTLEEVEVTATSSSNKTLLQQPASIVKLESRELKRSTGLFLDDAINTSVPGVFMERRTVSGGQQFNIRGYGNGIGFRGATNNFDSQGSKVYLNGIPITDAEGITMMDDIDFGSVDKVEVSKGPSGTLYGLAIAGVVNLQTRKAEKNKTSIGENFVFGSYGLLRSTTRIEIGGESSSLLVNYGHQEFDGYMVHTASKKDFVNVMGDFQLNDKQDLTTFFGYSNGYDERNGELSIEQYQEFDYSGNERYIKNNAHSAVTTFRAGIGHTYQFLPNISNTTTFFGSSQSLDNSSAGGWTDKSPLSYGLRSTFDMYFDVSDQVSLSGITGLELQKTNALSNGFRMVADSTNLEGYNIIGDIRSIQSTSSTTASYFTQWTLGLPKDIHITAGLGYSNMVLRLQDRLWAASNNHPGNTVPQEYKDTYNNLFSPSIAINKNIGSTASVYASYSVGYKAPVSSNFYIPTTGEVNTGLKPEKGIQFEVGTKGSMLDNRLFYSVAIFEAKFSDKMTTVSVQNPENTATLYSYIVNGGSLNNQGIEVLINYEILHSNNSFFTSVRPFANFTYSDFKYENYQYNTIGTGANDQDSVIVNDYSGNSVAGVPSVVFNMGVDFDTHAGLYGNVNYNFRDAMFFTSDEVNRTESFSLLNAKVGFRKSIHPFDLDVYAGANNITGSQHYYMVFLNQLPDAYLPAPYEINYFGGINLTYNF